MLVLDASVLFEIVADTASAPYLRDRLRLDPDQHAPHLIDTEVAAVIQRQWFAGPLDSTAAMQAIADLRSWPGQRWSHGPLLTRAWELRANVRMYDAVYVALAEGLDATLLTRDQRLASAAGPRCRIEVI